jgi:hypothetical protein
MLVLRRSILVILVIVLIALFIIISMATTVNHFPSTLYGQTATSVYLTNAKVDFWLTQTKQSQ